MFKTIHKDFGNPTDVIIRAVRMFLIHYKNDS